MNSEDGGRTMSATFRVDMAATDPEQAHQWLSQSYMPYEARFSGNSGQFRAQHASAQFDGFSVSLIDHYNVGAYLDSPPTRDFVMVAQPLDGFYDVTSGRDQIVARAGECFVVDPDAPVKIWQHDMRLSVVRIDRAALDQAAAELTGARLTAPIRFPLARPLSSQRSRRWQILMHELLREMPPEDDAVVLSAAQTRSLRLAAASLLETFPNSALQADPRSHGETHERALRRAVAFIDENATCDIDSAQIAEAARLTLVELNLAFCAHLHTTPGGYLDRVRLDRAHQALQRLPGGGADTVAELAAQWGFAHAGRFSTEYYRRFGHFPLQPK